MNTYLEHLKELRDYGKTLWNNDFVSALLVCHRMQNIVFEAQVLINAMSDSEEKTTFTMNLKRF
jgi:hypothetical protein